MWHTAVAEQDLEAIGDHIAKDDPRRPLHFVRELRDCCLGLADMPARFPPVERYAAMGIRRCLHGSYPIFYRIETERVAVLHVLHGAQDYEVFLSEQKSTCRQVDPSLLPPFPARRPAPSAVRPRARCR